jgi:outer membrane receptor for ferrienterochelin and colicin
MESTYKLERKLSSTVVTLKLENQTHVPDLATKIRILPGVAVVGQKTKVARFMDGDALLTLSVKFLPQTDEIFRSLKDLSQLIKKLPGVKTVSVETFNKRRITLKGKKIIF